MLYTAHAQADEWDFDRVVCIFSVVRVGGNVTKNT